MEMQVVPRPLFKLEDRGGAPPPPEAEPPPRVWDERMIAGTTFLKMKKLYHIFERNNG